MVLILWFLKEGGGGFLGPTISDVRDYHIDNFRFPTLLIYDISVSITDFVSEIRLNYAIFPFSAMEIGQFPTSAK